MTCCPTVVIVAVLAVLITVIAGAGGSGTVTVDGGEVAEASDESGHLQDGVRAGTVCGADAGAAARHLGS